MQQDSLSILFTDLGTSYGKKDGLTPDTIRLQTTIKVAVRLSKGPIYGRRICERREERQDISRHARTALSERGRVSVKVCQVAPASILLFDERAATSLRLRLWVGGR